MDSQQQLGYGLLRFRSASSFLLGSFAETGPGKLTPAPEGFEAQKLGSRFMGFSSSNMFDERLKESPAASPHGYTGLPLQYRRPSSVSSSSVMEGSYGTVGSMGMEPQSQPKLNSSDLARHSCSPPGLFTQPSTKNGKFLALHSPQDTVGLQIALFLSFPALANLDLTAAAWSYEVVSSSHFARFI